MNKLQPCGVVWWRGSKKKKEKKRTHTHCTHILQSPATVFPLFTTTHTHTHTPNHKAPSVPDQSVHQLMRSAGLGVLIITLLSGGLTKAYSHHAHTHSRTQLSWYGESASVAAIAGLIKCMERWQAEWTLETLQAQGNPIFNEMLLNTYFEIGI